MRSPSNPSTSPANSPKQHHANVLAPQTPRPVVDDVAVPVVVKSGSKSMPRIPEVYSIQWGSTLWLVALHIGALFAPWTFTWSGLGLGIFLYWLTGSLGICLGYHRLLTHTGLEIPQWLRRTFAFFGALAGEGGPVSWTANHRKHHAYSDQPGDPHTPHDGPWWSHMFWLAFSTHGGDWNAFVRHWVPDIIKDPFMMTLERWFLPIHIAFGAAITFTGYFLGGMPLALSWLVWAVCLRMVFLLHITWFVNSASHMWGYKNYDTRDESRNLWWVAILAHGEGWHNNHHALPRLAQHGHKWWEFDSTYQVIRLLRVLGLAKNVVDLASMEEKKRSRAERKVA